MEEMIENKELKEKLKNNPKPFKGSTKYNVPMGTQFYFLTVIGKPFSHGDGYYFIRCKCVCGKEKDIRIYSLVTKKDMVKSCGCKQRYRHNSRAKGHHKEKLYQVWSGMIRRCNNLNNHEYKWYGAKGIKVCLEWESDYLVFRDWALAHGYKERKSKNTRLKDGLSIHRLDADKNYCPENCVWIPMKENSRIAFKDLETKRKKLKEDNEMLIKENSILQNKLDLFTTIINLQAKGILT